MSARYARFPTLVAVGVYTMVVWANTGTGTTLTPSGAAPTER
jgi:hypothetical protein